MKGQRVRGGVCEGEEKRGAGDDTVPMYLGRQTANQKINKY